MRKNLSLISMLLIGSVAFNACEQSSDFSNNTTVPKDVLAKLTDLGFDVINQAPIKFQSGYLVEGDIFLTEHDLSGLKKGDRIPETEQYSTNNLVSGTRNISIYIPTSGSRAFSSAYVSALDVAIARYNAEGLRLTFSRTTSSSGATIKFTRLSSYYEWQGVLGSAGFPTSSGNPYGTVQMSGILQSSYGLSVNGIATIMAHELGHCIGFRHTDYYNRAISCGGSASNEGDGGVGANLIPGTPATASNSAKSWMLACTDGGDRPFNSDDKVALNYLY